MFLLAIITPDTPDTPDMLHLMLPIPTGMSSWPGHLWC